MKKIDKVRASGRKAKKAMEEGAIVYGGGGVLVGYTTRNMLDPERREPALELGDGRVSIRGSDVASGAALLFGGRIKNLKMRWFVRGAAFGWLLDSVGDQVMTMVGATPIGIGNRGAQPGLSAPAAPQGAPTSKPSGLPNTTPAGNGGGQEAEAPQADPEVVAEVTRLVGNTVTSITGALDAGEEDVA